MSRYGAQTIYALYDASGEPRYVGRTTQPLRVRLRSHWSRARQGSPEPVGVWLRSQPRGSVTIRALETENVVDFDEHIWIVLLRRLGHDLVNARSVVPDFALDDYLAYCVKPPCEYTQHERWLHWRHLESLQFKHAVVKGRLWALRAVNEAGERKRWTKERRSEVARAGWAKRRARLADAKVA